MRNQSQLFFGGFLILIGVLFLLGTLFQINAWALCWPTLLIVVGGLLLLRPVLAGPGQAVNFVLLGNVHRDSAWPVQNQEFWMGIGDVDLDFTRAEIPAGETHLRFYSFIGDVDMLVPETLGFALTANGFITDAKIAGNKEDSFLTPITYQSPNYTSAERKIKVELLSFITDLKIRVV